MRSTSKNPIPGLAAGACQRKNPQLLTTPSRTKPTPRLPGRLRRRRRHRLLPILQGLARTGAVPRRLRHERGGRNLHDHPTQLGIHAELRHRLLLRARSQDFLDERMDDAKRLAEARAEIQLFIVTFRPGKALKTRRGRDCRGREIPGRREPRKGLVA